MSGLLLWKTIATPNGTASNSEARERSRTARIVNCENLVTDSPKRAQRVNWTAKVGNPHPPSTTMSGGEGKLSSGAAQTPTEARSSTAK